MVEWPLFGLAQVHIASAAKHPKTEAGDVRHEREPHFSAIRTSMPNGGKVRILPPRLKRSEWAVRIFLVRAASKLRFCENRRGAVFRLPQVRTSIGFSAIAFAARARVQSVRSSDIGILG